MKVIHADDIGREELTEDARLDDVVEIEPVLLHIHSLNKQMARAKALKKYRMETINREISDLDEKLSLYKKLIFNTMKQLEPSEKTLKFPGVAKVTRRNNPDSWAIEDEKSFISYLKENQKDKGIIEVVEKINMQATKSLLNAAGELPGTKQVKGGESLSIAFEKKVSSEEKKEERNEVKKESEESCLDALEV